MSSQSKPPRVFIVDDNPGDRVLIRKMLRELAPTQFQVEEAWNLADAPTNSLPILVVSGIEDRQTAIDALDSGAQGRVRPASG